MKRQVEQRTGRVLRSLANYIKQHRAKHPQVVQARTLTEARKLCFGHKRKQKAGCNARK